MTEREGVRIAAIRTELGPVVIARLDGEGDGGTVLDDENGVPVARPAS